MTDTQLVQQARDMLETLTPLKRDCGALCAAACCQDPEDGDELLGMELFPGEKALYPAKSSWYKLYPSHADGVTVLVCRESCPRQLRPLACRIFPLVPYVKNGRLIIRMDPRSAGLCPLYAQGKRALDPAFVSAVQEAMALLWQSEAMRAYFVRLSGLIDESTGGLI